MRLYVGNLPFSSKESDLLRIFGDFGAIEDVAIVSDRETGRSRGFGFVTMPNEDEARKAIEELNGKDVDGRAIQVNEARPRTERSGGGYCGGGGGRGGRDRGGDRW